MRKIALTAASLALFATGSFATTTTTTITINGKCTSSATIGTTTAIACDNTVDLVCYTTTTTTQNEEVPGTMNPGDPVTINFYDQKGNPTQQYVSGLFVSAQQQQDPNNQNVTDYFFTLNYQQ